MNATTATRKAQVFAKASTETLVQSALYLDSKTEYTEAERVTLAWINDELTDRMGGIVDDEAFDNHIDNGCSYFEALLLEFPGLAA